MTFTRHLTIGLLCMGACDPGNSQAPLPPSDSGDSGVPPASWGIADAPDFLVSGGLAQGDSVHFISVRTGAFLPGGEVVVTGSDARVVFIDSLGEFRDVLGGPGEGPQEFIAVPFIARSGENLLLVERGAGRVRDLWNSGFGDPRPYVPADGRHTMAAAFDDGVVVSAPIGLAIGRPESDHTTWHSVTHYLLWDGETVDTLLGPPSPPLPSFPFRTPGGFQSGFSPGRAGCLPTNHFGVRDGRLLIANGAGVLFALDRAGALDTIFRSDRRGSVTREMVDGALAYLREVEARAPHDAFLGRVGHVGDTLSATWADAVWGEDTVWLRHSSPCFVGAPGWPQRYDVLDLEAGRLLGVAEVPAELRLLAVAEDRVLAVVTDDLQVQYVGVYRIRRGETQ